MASDRHRQNSLNGKVFGRKEGTAVVTAIFFRMRICQGKSTVTAEDLLYQTFQQLLFCLSLLSVTCFESLCLIWTAVADSQWVLLTPFSLPTSVQAYLILSLFTLVTKSPSKMQICLRVLVTLLL